MRRLPPRAAAALGTERSQPAGVCNRYGAVRSDGDPVHITGGCGTGFAWSPLELPSGRNSWGASMRYSRALLGLLVIALASVIGGSLIPGTAKHKAYSEDAQQAKESVSAKRSQRRD